MATTRAIALAQRPLPRAGVRASAGSYRATQHTRSRVRVGAGGGDHHADDISRKILRELSRDLERNAEPYFIMLHGVARLLGAPVPRPTTTDREWNLEVARRWRAKARRKRGGFDVRGMKTWADLCRTWWATAFRDGDLLTLPLEDERAILTVEADCIAGGRGMNQFRRVVGGATLDQLDRVLQWWVCRRNRYGMPDLRTAEPYDAAVAQHLAFLTSTSQTRGVPILAAGLDNQERIDALVESEVISSEQASNIYGAFKRQLAQGQIASEAPLAAGGDTPAAVYSGSDNATNDPSYLDFPAGSYWDLPAGVEWQSIKTERPNLDVPEFLRHILRQSCAYFGIPYAVLFADFHGINWSGNRGLVSITRDGLADLRTTYCDPFLDPHYDVWLAGEMRYGGLRAPRGVAPADAYAHAWDWPSRPEWPDPLKEEQRHELALRQDTDSLHRILGPDWEDILAERQDERLRADRLYIERYFEAAQAIEEVRQAYPNLAVDLSPREVIARELDGTARAQLSDPEDPAADDPPTDPSQKAGIRRRRSSPSDDNTTDD